MQAWQAPSLHWSSAQCLAWYNWRHLCCSRLWDSHWSQQQHHHQRARSI